MTSDPTRDNDSWADADFHPAPRLPALAGKATDLEALRTAVVDAAGVGFGIWITWLGALLYLAVASAGVTHKDLLFENPVKLPFLNVDLPLTSFFVVAPFVFVLLHAYVLLHFVMLSDKIAAFNGQLYEQLLNEPARRTALRRQLPSNIFVQFLAGPRDLREGIVGWMLAAIALFSLVIGPFLLTILFELRFLPYHLEWATWWQRILVAADVALALRFWPSIARRDSIGTAPDGEVQSRASRVRGRILAGAAPVCGVAAVALVGLIATFPGEWLEEALTTASTRREAVLPAVDESTEAWLMEHQVTVFRLTRTWAREILVDGEVNPAKGVPESWFSNRLVLPGVVADEYLKQDTDGRIVSVRRAMSLRDRDLRRAVLPDAKFEKADLTAADLRDAVLNRADLRAAKLSCAQRYEPERDGGPSAAANRPRPKCTSLQGASLDGASLQGASLYWASLQGASLDRASLQGASLNWASLQGASLNGASLQGASLFQASLQGASLDGASLQGASLDGASLQGASLDRASLQGASLDGASLQGASLDRASLQGASLDGASLQGASLDGASLQGASLDGASVWRSTALNSVMSNAYLKNLNLSTPPGCQQRSNNDPCEWTQMTFTAFREAAAKDVPEGPNRTAMLDRLNKAFDPATPADRVTAGERDWSDRQQASATIDQMEQERARQLQQAGCEPDGAPFAVKGIAARIGDEVLAYLKNPFFADNSPHRATLAKAFRAESCAGAKGLDAHTTAQLQQWANPPPPTTRDPLDPTPTSPTLRPNAPEEAAR